MTLADAMTAHGPGWLQYWMIILGLGGGLAPLLLLIWKQSRAAGVFGLVAFGLSFIGVDYLYNQLGYVKLLGLPHILFWTPLVVLYARKIRQDGLPEWPRRIIIFALVIILISLAFDYTDFLRYILGERTPLALPPVAS